MTRKRRNSKSLVPVTLSTVAREAAVSEITVSRVIRGKGPVADVTRSKVLTAIRQTGYLPNRLAGSLASARSALIGVVVPSLDNIVFADVLRGLNAAISAEGLRAVVSISGYDPEAERACVHSLLSWRPEALVITGLEHQPQTVELIRKAGITTIEIMDIDTPPIDVAVGMSHREAGEAAARHLLGRGYRSFGYVGHDIDRDLRARKRYLGFLTELDQARADLPGDRLTGESASIEAGRVATAELLAAHPGIEAVYFSNDDMALGGVFHCLAEGINLPDDLALFGFNGLAVGQALPLPLSTTLTHRFRIGQHAGEAILARIAGRDVPARDDVGFELLPGATA